MKKFTFLMIALLTAVVTFAAGPKKQFAPQLFTNAKAQVQLGNQFRAKQAPARLAKQTKGTAMARAPKKAATATDLAGTYLWEYAMSSNKAVDPTTVEGTDYSAYVTITAGDDETVTISGMFTNDLTGTIYTEYGVIVVEGGQIAGTSSYGDYAIYGLFYYEGDEDYEAGWYDTHIYIDINEDGSLTVEDWLVRVLSGGTYDGHILTPYFMPGSTLTPEVVEKAAMPADPAITALKNGSYGWYITFNVPNVDVDGNVMVTSKLSYIIYTDTEGEIAPLTFTPETHEKLTEEMAEIPYGFTESWDFYDTSIYLNDLYSADWNKIGIQSIYRGGGEKNATEIQWYRIKDYELVTLPEGVEAEEFTLTIDNYYGKTKATKLVAFDGDDVYVQGLAYYFPEAFVKGTLNEDGQYVFKSGQFVGEDKYGAEYLIGLSIDEDNHFQYEPEFVFDFDAESRKLSLVEGTYFGESGKKDEASIWAYTYSAVYTEGALVLPDVVEVPEDLVTEPYLFNGYDTSWKEDMDPYQVQVGFYGDNEVYIQGLSTYIEDAWVKGMLENGVLTIPEAYLGEYKGWFSTYDIYFPKTEFIYDAEAGTFTSEAGFSTYDDDGYSYDEVSNVVLTKIVEKAATPADPSVKNFVLIGVDDEGNTTDADDNPIFVTYPRVEFDIPVVDVNGDPMLQDKLSYVIYVVDKDGVLKELTLTTDLYEKLEEDMTEIPYLFDDDLDIYTGGKTVYLNQDPKEIITWKKIGVQSIYCGLGEEHRSNIGWFDITGYLNKNIFTTGIRNIAADNQETDYFDLQGRMVTAIQKGMLIKQTRNANGTVKTVKVVRK